MEIGIYEKLITNSVKQKLNALNKNQFEIIQGKNWILKRRLIILAFI